MQKSRKYKRLFATVLLAVFAIYYVNINFFYHCHVINGVTIVHSHFYGGQHTTSGSHTNSELTLISALSFLQALVSIFLFFAAFHLPVQLFFAAKESLRKANNPYLEYISFRAPPAKFFDPEEIL